MRDFDLRSYLSKLPSKAKEITIPRLKEYGELTDEDIRIIMEKDIIPNLPRYKRVIEEDKLLRFICVLFRNHLDYLARALVQLRPEVFYNEGIASRVVNGLRAELGTVVLPPVRPTGGYDPIIYMKELPMHVRQDLFSLYRECRFRDYLYYMSRDSKVGFKAVAEEIAQSTNRFEREVLQDLRGYCKRLFAMKFPDFVSEINGEMFPAFNVRWWIDQAKTVERVLNIGGTSTYKTSFAVVGMYTYGCRKILYLCPAHARVESTEKIRSYFRDPRGKVFLVASRDDITMARQSYAQFTVISYSTLFLKTSHGTVLEQLQQIPFDGLVVDESQYINNATGSHPAKRALACQQLVQTLLLRRFMALSATPWENDPNELGAVVSAIMPDVIPTPEVFRRWGLRDERFLREFLSKHIVGANLRDIVDLPPIDPKPWEDPFGVELIEPNPWHTELYRFVREDEGIELIPVQKVSQLLLATTHPHKLEGRYEWPAGWEKRFRHWDLSTKLVWLRKHINEALNQGERVVVGTGIYADGITRVSAEVGGDGDKEAIWVGKLLRKWFGSEHILILDGRVSATVDASGSGERDRLVQRWRNDPSIWILLVSMRACPDAVQLCVKKRLGFKGLFLTAISFGWKPWEQFRSRFYRKEQEVPIRYRVPILKGTIDENLLRLNRQKLESWERFHARSPLTVEYFLRLSPDSDMRRLVEENRPSIEQVKGIGRRISGGGEKAAEQFLNQAYGVSTYGEVFARAFLETQEFSASGHISRCMEIAVNELEKQEPVHSGEDIFDAGCGPLTFERRLNRPVYGVDMNPHMIEIGRVHSSKQGVNARVGFLSRLPREWTGKFRLTVCSLALHWSLRDAERMAILSELVRVTHPLGGRIWIASAESTMDRELHTQWVEAFRSLNFVIVEEFTGLIRALDTHGSKQRFQFWSLCFSPNGQRFLSQNHRVYRFLHEEERRKYIRGDGRSKKRQGWEHDPVLHRSFEVVGISGERLPLAEAARLATQKQRDRLAGQSWRVLAKLQQRGILKLA